MNSIVQRPWSLSLFRPLTKSSLLPLLSSEFAGKEKAREQYPESYESNNQCHRDEVIHCRKGKPMHCRYMGRAASKVGRPSQAEGDGTA
jgi:hypothetical protein